MKKSRFSVEQTVAALKQVEPGMPVADLTRRLGISEQTFYRWKKQYAGLQADQVRELKQPQEENARLKRLVAELSLNKAMLQENVFDPYMQPEKRLVQALLLTAIQNLAREHIARIPSAEPGYPLG